MFCSESSSHRPLARSGALIPWWWYFMGHSVGQQLPVNGSVVCWWCSCCHDGMWWPNNRLQCTDVRDSIGFSWRQNIIQEKALIYMTKLHFLLQAAITITKSERRRRESRSQIKLRLLCFIQWVRTLMNWICCNCSTPSDPVHQLPKKHNL